jgi:hypothetical protein
MADQVPEERPPDAACFFGCPNDGDALGLEDGIEWMMLLVTKNGTRGHSLTRRISG